MPVSMDLFLLILTYYSFYLNIPGIQIIICWLIITQVTSEFVFFKRESKIFLKRNRIKGPT
jgi:hypothetical protein